MKTNKAIAEIFPRQHCKSERISDGYLYLGVFCVLFSCCYHSYGAPT